MGEYLDEGIYVNVWGNWILIATAIGPKTAENLVLTLDQGSVGLELYATGAQLNSR